MRKIIIKKDEFMGITERRKLEKEIIRKKNNRHSKPNIS